MSEAIETKAISLSFAAGYNSADIPDGWPRKLIGDTGEVPGMARCGAYAVRPSPGSRPRVLSRGISNHQHPTCSVWQSPGYAWRRSIAQPQVAAVHHRSPGMH